jgi:hypothetical protein
LNDGTPAAAIQFARRPAFNIGQRFGGGRIFYIDGTGEHGLIVSSKDQSAGGRWGCYSTAIGGTSTTLGSGNSNTSAIINGCPENASIVAAKLARSYKGGGYNDWYLPSLDELGLLYAQRVAVDMPGYSIGYWSSSEYDAGSAYGYSWQGYPYVSLKNNVVDRVRAIRAF